MTGPCRCHDPRVWGHRADCPDGHAFLQHWEPHLDGDRLRRMADEEARWWNAPPRPWAQERQFKGYPW